MNGYSFIHSWMGRYLAFDAFWISGMGYCEYLCRDLCVHILISPGHVPRSGTAGSYGNDSFEELPACIQSAAAFLFRQQCRRLLAFCTVASTVFLIIALVLGVKCFLMSWICISSVILMLSTCHELLPFSVSSYLLAYCSFPPSLYYILLVGIAVA